MGGIFIQTQKVGHRCGTSGNQRGGEARGEQVQEVRLITRQRNWQQRKTQEAGGSGEVDCTGETGRREGQSRRVAFNLDCHINLKPDHST